MKIRLPYPLRAALTASIFTLSSYPLSTAHAAGVVSMPNEAIDKVKAIELLTTTTLTKLYLNNPSQSPLESAYTLEETSAVAAGTLHITQYTWDVASHTLTPVVYNVNIKQLGDTVSLDTSFNWSKDTSTGQLTLLRENSYHSTADVLTSSDYTTGIVIANTDIYRHFVGIHHEVNQTGSLTTELGVFGGALVHQNANLTDVSITGHFIGNSVEGTISATVSGSTFIPVLCSAQGGAIYSEMAITSITGDFIGNSASATALNSAHGFANTSTNAYAYGGAIFSTAIITRITGDFIGNSALASVNGLPDSNTSIHAYGGAIYGEAAITYVTGDFIGNSVSTSGNTDNESSPAGYAYGGAIYSESSITYIKGDFIGNSTNSDSKSLAYAYGGAIYSSGAITSVASDFIRNSSIAFGNVLSDAQGGAIFSDGSLESIAGDFIANAVIADGSTHARARGGAIFSEGRITSIAGDFIGNSVSASAARSVEAQGGAIYNSHTGEILALRANFIDNSTSASDTLSLYAQLTSQGGAIYNEGKIQFLADKSSILLSGNYTSVNVGSIKNYQAIHNEYKDTSPATIHFNAYEGYSIVLNDGISGRDDERLNQILHINQVMSGTEDFIAPSASAFSTVYFNSLVEHQTIHVHAGELIFGSFTRADEKSATYGSLGNSVLSISAGAIAEFTPDGITSSLDLGKNNTIINDGTIRINFEGKTLTRHLSSLTPDSLGSITYTGISNANADFIDVDYSVTASDSLTLTGGSLQARLTGTDNITIAEGVTLSGTLAVDELHFTSDSESQLTVTTSGNFSASMLSVDTASTPFSRTLMSWEEAGDVIALDDFRALLHFNGLALYKTDFSLTLSADGLSYILGSTITGLIYEGQTIAGDQVVGNDLRHANFKSVNAQGANFSTLYLKLATFEGANLRNTNFADAYLGGVSFQDAIINDANFSSTRADDEDISIEQIRSTASYKKGDLSGVNFTGVDLSSLTTRAANEGLGMQGFNLQDSNFTATGIAASQMERADLRGATFDPTLDLRQLNAYITTTDVGDQLVVRNGKLGGALTLYSTSAPSQVQLSDALTLGTGDTLTLQEGQSLYVTMTGSLLAENGSHARIHLERAIPSDATWSLGPFITWHTDDSVLSIDELEAILSINGSSLSDLGYYIYSQNNGFNLTNTKPVPNSYTQLGSSDNGNAGGELLDDAIQRGNKLSSDLESVIDTLDVLYRNGGSATAESDRLLAAVAGAGVTSLGSAALGNIEGQLTRMRNRAGGFIPAGESSLWIVAEGSRHELSGDGTAAGHSIDSWGGSVGADWGIAESTSVGVALTVLYGDLYASSVDHANGDINSYYLSLAAQHQRDKWQHRAHMSWGLTDGSLDRHVSHANGSYSTSGDTSGYSFGLMYELGYDIKLSENSTLTPIFNATLIHSYLDSYTETGSDTALHVGEQSNTVATFGIGTRVESKLDFGLRMGARALLKVDVGERTQQADVSITSVPESRAQVESAQAGSVGLELGVGTSMPVNTHSALFLDASVDLRDKQQSYNTSVGYKLSF